MNKNSVIGIALVVVIAIAIGGYIFPNQTQKVVERLGANPGPEVLNAQYFRGGFFDGGTVVATSTTDTTSTLTSAEFIQGDRITRLLNFSPSVTGITATLPATSTLSNFVPKAGDTRTVALCNATTTAAVSFTLAAGTGMNLHQATSTLAIRTGICAELEFVRNSDRDIEVFYDLGY